MFRFCDSREFLNWQITVKEPCVSYSHLKSNVEILLWVSKETGLQVNVVRTKLMSMLYLNLKQAVI
jgi:hypothetical protein